MNSQIKKYNNRPTIFIDNKAYCPIIYSLTDCPGGRLSYEEIPNHNVKQFVAMGVKLYQLDIWLEDMWFEDGRFDITIAKKQVTGITNLNSDAAVFFRFHTTAPQWWCNQNINECVDFADSPRRPETELDHLDRYLIQDQDNVYRHSYASKKWAEDSKKMLERFIEEFQECEESKNLAGIQIATGLYGENHYWAFMKHEPDTSLPMTLAFREYLKEKYTNNENLQKAWANNDVSLDNASVPGMDLRYATFDGIFRDPEKEMQMIDYTQCQHDIVANSIVDFCKVVKDNWNGQIITGAFYCYYISLFGRAASGGHLSEQIVLNSPYIDYISAPQAYNQNLRNIGGAGISRGLLDSILLHNKLLLDEVDHPTHVGTIMAGMKVYPKYESLQILRRNIITSFLKGMGFWYYDFGPNNYSGWWNNKEYRDEIFNMNSILEKYFKLEYQNESEVLFIFDTAVYKYTANNDKDDPITDKGLVNISYPMALRSGVAIDSVYLSDIEKVDFNKYKVVVFMNTFVIEKSQKDFIKINVLNNNRTIIWNVAPGYISNEHSSINNIVDLTNFEVIKNNSIEKPFKISEISNYKQFKNYSSYYIESPIINPEEYRDIFSSHGVHIYNNYNDALLSGNGLLMINSELGGNRTIKLKNKKEIPYEFNKGETIIIDSNSGEILRSK